MLLAIGLGLFLHHNYQGDGTSIKAFTSDGCSAWPDGTLFEKTLLQRCCTTHDMAYWRGGTFRERQAADQALKVCVAEVGEPEIAAIMLAGVRVGGSPNWPTTFRWGYGWQWLRGYKSISSAEQNIIDSTLKPQPATQ